MASKDVKEILAQMKMDNDMLRDTVNQIALNTEAMVPALVEMAKALTKIAQVWTAQVTITGPSVVVTGDVCLECEGAEKEVFDHLLRTILVSEEGYKEVVYPSAEGGNPTAGIGHKLLDSEMPRWGSVGTPVPKDQVEAWYTQDIATATRLARGFLGDNKSWNRLSTLRRVLVVCQCFQMGDLSDWQPTLAHIKAEEWDDVRDHILSSKWGRLDTPERAARMAAMWVTDTILPRYDGVDTH